MLKVTAWRSLPIVFLSLTISILACGPTSFISGGNNPADDVSSSNNNIVAENNPPSVNTGSNFSVTVNTTANLNGSATDDGLPNPPAAMTFAWIRVSGPAQVNIANPGNAITTAVFSTAGTYIMRLTASDSALSAQDDVTVTVNPLLANQAPIVSAGGDAATTVGTTMILSGSATDDGLPNPPGALTYTWTRVSGPGTATITNPNAAISSVVFSGAAVGIHVLRLSVSDSDLSAFDEISITVTASSGGNPGITRGYMTTATELQFIRTQWQAHIEPYYSAGGRSSSEGILGHAGAPNEWHSSVSGGISGSQSCGGTQEPGYIFFGGQEAYAKALTYHLTGNAAYAQEVRSKIVGMLDTSGFGGESYSGGNQCILNLSWYIPSWIWAADLIEGVMTPSEKSAFQTWLAEVVYRKVDWASDERANNWGTAASAAAGTIADYLSGSGIQLVDRNNLRLGAAAAFAEAKQRQVDRMVGNNYMDYDCSGDVGIRNDGGIPEELRRGSTGCDGLYLVSADSSHSYSCTSQQGFAVHAELLKRRGDLTLYNYTNPLSAPLLKTVRFVIANPNSSSHSYNFTNSSMSVLELAYKHYQDGAIATRLGIGGNRTITSTSGQMLHFGTLTHGFANGSLPPLTPITALPTN